MTEIKDERTAFLRTSKIHVFDHGQSPADLLKEKINYMSQNPELINNNISSYLEEILEYVDKLDRPAFINPLAFILGRLGVQNNKLVTKENFRKLGAISKKITTNDTKIDYKVDIVDIIRYSRLWLTLFQ